ADGGVRGVLACGSDVTAQVAARLELERERELRERFVATLSHDLRTPLSSARLGAEMINDAAVSPDVTRSAVRITRNIDRADRMLQDLLDVSRIKAGERLPLEATEGDLVAIAEDVLRELTALHGDRFVVCGAHRLVGRWSASGIRRIVENLCSNAVKYGASDTPVTVTIRAHAGLATIAVHNVGTPIPAVDIPSLFEPFRRVGSAEVAGHRSWGLGLTLVRGVAEAHDGHVAVTSSAAEGTTFTVTLPIARDQDGG
ncbi:MAG TPA: HAMP domain-containing sensor histidine kinase, partial [Kofleriaceae bacterium]|nr:HAMP domain-containing sensor histidine kinase [Kofleriaceae bacterium]